MGEDPFNMARGCGVSGRNIVMLMFLVRCPPKAVNLRTCGRLQE